MKSVFLSILCSVLLSNICLAMDKSHSISAEKLAGWDTLDDDIQLAQAVQNPQDSKKPLGWFPLFNAVRSSLQKKTLKKSETLVHVLKPKIETVQTSTAVSAVIITTIATQNSLPTTMDDQSSSIITQNQEQQNTTLAIVRTILPVKKSPSRENLYQNNNSLDTTMTDQSNIIPQTTCAIISPLQRKKSMTVLHNYDSDNSSSSSTKTNSSNSSSTSTLITPQDDSIQAINIDRNSNDSTTEHQIQEQTSLFAMLQKGCCNCFDINFNVLSDLESKKKSSK